MFRKTPASRRRLAGQRRASVHDVQHDERLPPKQMQHDACGRVLAVEAQAIEGSRDSSNVAGTLPPSTQKDSRKIALPMQLQR